MFSSRLLGLPSRGATSITVIADTTAKLPVLASQFVNGVNGSFVTLKENPADIDLITFVDGVQFEAQFSRRPLREKEEIRRLLCGEEMKVEYRCDVFFASLYPEGHPLTRRGNGLFEYWREMFGGTREGSRKGFLEVELR